MRLRYLVFILALTTVGCAPKLRHSYVVADAAVTEALSDIHNIEQAALAQGTLGWNIGKSQAFNHRLLLAVDSALKFNESLKAWKVGDPAPDNIKILVNSLMDALSYIVSDFPSGPNKDLVLTKIVVAQRLISNALMLYAGGN